MERSLRALLFLGIDFLFPDHLRPRAEAAEIYFDGSHPLQDYLLKLSVSHLRAVITKDPAHEAMLMCQ
ncbi:MAG: hypothetical protein IKN43_05415, partial [Selenomonadaceae bacterium]|nr:hypothetical protein [Selenomonadaceae bacterium]